MKGNRQMARPRKLKSFRRFSLRLPAYVLKGLRHWAVEEECSVNDLLNCIAVDAKTFRESTKQQPLQVSDRVVRYPWRAPDSCLGGLRHQAGMASLNMDRNISMNQAMLDAVMVATTRAGWLKTRMGRRAA